MWSLNAVSKTLKDPCDFAKARSISVNSTVVTFHILEQAQAMPMIEIDYPLYEIANQVQAMPMI